MQFGDELCSSVFNRVLSTLSEVIKFPCTKLYVIYYQGKYPAASIWNNKLHRYETKYSNPKRGAALIKAQEIRLAVKDVKFSETDVKFSEADVILIDGGFRYIPELELWAVPKNVELPKPTPTHQETDE